MSLTRLLTATAVIVLIAAPAWAQPAGSSPVEKATSELSSGNQAKVIAAMRTLARSGANAKAATPALANGYKGYSKSKNAPVIHWNLSRMSKSTYSLMKSMYFRLKAKSWSCRKVRHRLILLMQCIPMSAITAWPAVLIAA